MPDSLRRQVKLPEQPEKPEQLDRAWLDAAKPEEVAEALKAGKLDDVLFEGAPSAT